MRARQQHLRTVLATGPLTIEQIRTARGAEAYKFTARSKLYAYPDDLNKLKQWIDSELELVNTKRRKK